jgi:transposase
MATESKEIRLLVARLESIIKEYKEENPAKKRNYQQYEKEFRLRLRTCFEELKPLVQEAVSIIKVESGENRGNDTKMTLEQRVILLLLKQLCGKSNRCMEWMMVMFTLLTKVDVSYKTIERIYSDRLVQLALYNLHVLILRKRGIDHADCCGDGTGYALFVKVHYATETIRRKNKIKENNSEDSKHIKIIYSFAFMDIKTRLYIGFGTSFKSEKEAFERALEIAKETGVVVDTLRLDRYYSAESYVDKICGFWTDVKMYLIPKKNIASLGLGELCRMLHRFTHDIKGYLKEYFKRNQAESGYAEDKRRTGWRISQKLPSRVDTAYSANALLHNLHWMGA